MSFFIRKPTAAGDVWLRRIAAGIIWGPRDLAISFLTRGEATRALQKLPPKERKSAEVGSD